MAIHKLTAAKLKRLVQGRVRGKHNDGGSLYLQITKRSMTWIFRYRIGDRERAAGLGPVTTVTIDEAREEARLRRLQLLRGIDPLGQRGGRKAMTFERAFREYWTGRKPHVDPKSRVNHENRMIKYALPVLGHMRIDAVSQADVLAVLEPLWLEKTKTASALRAEIEGVIDWAIGKGHRAGVNVAAWRLLRTVLVSPKRVAKVEHHAALPFAELPAFMVKLREAQGDDANIPLRALEFTILTAVRTGDIVGQRGQDAKPPLRWTDLDLDAGAWKIPNPKGGIAHVVALPDRAVAILREVRGFGLDPDLVLPIGKDAMRQALGTIRAGLTVHGFRATFKTWAGKMTVVPREIVEEALAHRLLGDPVELVYVREDPHFAKRRALMAAWAAHCDGVAPTVVPLPAAKAA
jgi:integrase